MKVTFNQDEKTATDLNGKVYKIKGLIVRMPKEKNLPDHYYEFGSEMCNAVIFKGITCYAIDLGNGQIDLL
jgi:hypothetical protein